MIEWRRLVKTMVWRKIDRFTKTFLFCLTFQNTCRRQKYCFCWIQYEIDWYECHRLQLHVKYTTTCTILFLWLFQRSKFTENQSYPFTSNWIGAQFCINTKHSSCLSKKILPFTKVCVVSVAWIYSLYFSLFTNKSANSDNENLCLFISAVGDISTLLTSAKWAI